MWFLVLWACHGAADVYDLCDPGPPDTGDCLECSVDDDCHITGNPCLASAWCANRDAEVVTVQLGCSEAMEYRWPDDETCRCQGGTCTYDP
jgi:hypothetical protein